MAIKATCEDVEGMNHLLDIVRCGGLRRTVASMAALDRAMLPQPDRAFIRPA
jgi:hypothetical protein